MIAEHNPWNPATRYLVQTCPFDEDAALLRPREAMDVLRAVGFQIVARDFVSFFPGRLRPLQRFEPWLWPVPLSAQYIVMARRDG